MDAYCRLKQALVSSFDPEVLSRDTDLDLLVGLSSLAWESSMKKHEEHDIVFRLFACALGNVCNVYCLFVAIQMNLYFFVFFCEMMIKRKFEKKFDLT